MWLGLERGILEEFAERQALVSDRGVVAYERRSANRNASNRSYRAALKANPVKWARYKAQARARYASMKASNPEKYQVIITRARDRARGLTQKSQLLTLEIT